MNAVNTLNERVAFGLTLNLLIYELHYFISTVRVLCFLAYSNVLAKLQKITT
jgi:hypothetical protein